MFLLTLKAARRIAGRSAIVLLLISKALRGGIFFMKNLPSPGSLISPPLDRVSAIASTMAASAFVTTGLGRPFRTAE